ncbi:MAG: hypothetical protein IJV01_01445 [Bacteroidales bacterium]|nr:hypothetical protein [Bacteroidales bacterium]
MNKNLFLVGLAVLSVLVSCRPDSIRDAIGRQLQQYPESRVQDIYKSFCQDALGPGHLIPHPDAARSYLMSELEVFRAQRDSGLCPVPRERFVPVGDEGNYVRVDLSVVLDSVLNAETLLDAFVRSANEGKRLTVKAWTTKWADVAKVIRSHFPAIPDADKDLTLIDSLMVGGHYILHHSAVYNGCYLPHYRIVARDIFEKEIKAAL